MSSTRKTDEKQTYEVRVSRSFEEEYLDIEVQASSEEEAEQLALAEAKAKPHLYFGAGGSPSYRAESAELADPTHV